MSTLRTNDKKILEKLFQMAGGSVLNFTNRTMKEFFWDNLGVDVYSEQYDYESGSKANRMRAFWAKARDQDAGICISDLIEYIENEILLGNLKSEDFNPDFIKKAREIGDGLSDSGAVNKQDETIFLNADFDDVYEKIKQLDTEEYKVLEQRLNEIEKCLKNDIHLGAIFLVGSTLEGILFELGTKHKERFIAAKLAPQKNGKVIPFDQWKLSGLIDTAHELGYLGLNAKKFSHAVRDFRNFIHPREQAKHKFNPDKHTAAICFQVLKSAIDDVLNSPKS